VVWRLEVPETAAIRRLIASGGERERLAGRAGLRKRNSTYRPISKPTATSARRWPSWSSAVCSQPKPTKAPKGAW